MSPLLQGTVTEQIRAAVAGLPSPVFSTAELAAALPDVKREIFDQTLLRMIQDGTLQRLKRGFYQRSDEPIDAEEESAKPVAMMPVTMTGDLPKIANLIWTTADEVLRGDYKPHEYGSVILPFTVMRRIDCVLAPTKLAVLESVAKAAKIDIDPAFIFEKATDGLKFWNTSKFDFATLANDHAGLKKNLIDYVGGFSESIRDIFDYYKINDLINDMDRKKLLFPMVQKFAGVNLHPDVVSNADMGHAFEELIRRFNEQSNETAGEHYTPRDAIRLAVELLFSSDEDPTLIKEQRIVTLYDPCVGTGGMLSVSEEHLLKINSSVKVRPYGQELNEQTYAICKADMLIKGQDIGDIRLGNTLGDDKFRNETFDYMLSNPPYGVDWKKVKDEVEAEHRKLGDKGRFGPGLPRISDGQTLFLLHLISKMHPNGSGDTSRIAIVMNGSPLFSGGAGSGESEIRKYILENDLLEAIVALPTEMFYNTGIATFIWILSNNKESRRVGKVQLVNGADFYVKMRKSLGNKRRQFTPNNIATIRSEYQAFAETDCSKLLSTTAFGYSMITVERPLRLAFQVTPQRLALLDREATLTKNDIDVNSLKATLSGLGDDKVLSRAVLLARLNPALKKAKITLKPPQQKALLAVLSERDAEAEVCTNMSGEPEADPELRDTENVPLAEDVGAYFEREVKPYVPDAWIDESKTKIGYEIPFTRYFYKFAPPRSLAAIDGDLAKITGEIVQMLSAAAS